jgi:penicillin amidase
MELVRRVALGKLAEIIPEGLAADRLTRTLGFHRLGKIDVEHQLKNNVNPKTGEKELDFLDAYVNGVNAYLKSPEFKKPVEFTVLNITPTEWKNDEVGAVARMLSWQMSRCVYYIYLLTMCRGWHFKITNLGVLQAMNISSNDATNLDILNTLFDLRENESPTTLPSGNVEINWKVFDEVVKNQPPTDQGSNAWVVSGKFTHDGKPLLAADPHLAQSLPNVWFQNHLIVRNQGKTTLNATGVSMPGSPFILIGHNDHTAWGITLSYADVADVFLEKLSQDKKTYEFKGEQLPIKEIQEVIQVKGKEPFVETVRITHHGPIISGLVNYTDTPTEFSLSATYLKDTLNFPMEAFLELNQATNAKQVRKALLQEGLPTLNVVFADSEGNIGYQMTGDIPIRTEKAIQTPNVPLNGWDGEYEWQGYLDVKENPAAINPEQGYIISCNHRIVGPDYKHYLGSSFKYGARAIRIKELLVETLRKNDNKVTLKDFAKWQNDITEPRELYQPIVSLIKDNIKELEKIVPIEEK